MTAGETAPKGNNREQNQMASTTADNSDLGPIHDVSQYSVEEERYATILQRWKEEQALRLEAEHSRDGFKIMAHRLALKVSQLETQLQHARDAAQQLRAIL